MSRVEGSEKRSLLGREPSRRFENAGSNRRRRPTVGEGMGGGSEDGGACNDCLARTCGLRNGRMRSRCCMLIVFFLLLVGVGYGAYYGYEKYESSSSSSDDDDGDDSSSHHHHSHDTEGDDGSAVLDGSVDAGISDDGERRNVDKADHGADFLPAGGANADDEADEGFGARIRRHLRGTQ